MAMFTEFPEIDPATTPFHGSDPSNLHIPKMASPDWLIAMVIPVPARETFQIPCTLSSLFVDVEVLFSEIDVMLSDEFWSEAVDTLGKAATIIKVNSTTWQTNLILILILRNYRIDSSTDTIVSI
jgi:hypothetical protein